MNCSEWAATQSHKCLSPHCQPWQCRHKYLNFCRLLPLKPLPALEVPFDTHWLRYTSGDTACTSTANKQRHNEPFSPPWSWRWDPFLITGYLEGFISSGCLNTQMTASIRDRQQRRKAIYLLGEGNADVRHRQPGWDCQELRFLSEPSHLATGMELGVKEKLHSASQAGLACILGQTEPLWFHPFLSQGLSTCWLHKATGHRRGFLRSVCTPQSLTAADVVEAECRPLLTEAPVIPLLIYRPNTPGKIDFLFRDWKTRGSQVAVTACLKDTLRNEQHLKATKGGWADG